MNANCLVRTTIILATLMALSGCLGRSQQTRFYLLNPIQSPETTEVMTAKKDLRIGVGPVILPEYLDRPQIVTQVSKSEHRVDEFNQWAETLTFSISRVIAGNLSTFFSTENLFIFPWLGSTQIDYQVKLDIIDFKGTPDGKVILKAQYTILDGSRNLLEMNVVDTTQPISEPGYEGLVSSMNKALDELSRKIATKIIALSKEETL